MRLQKITVTITHGDLCYARYPVIVGHYAGDTIVSAEDRLDKALGGRLRAQHRLGLYPGRVGSCHVQLNTERNGTPAGAIVIGLGRVGELSPGSLQAAITQAVLQYAFHVNDSEHEQSGTSPTKPRAIGITSLLIGSGSGGMSLRDSIEAILRGVTAANRLLHTQKQKVRIGAVELLELWQDLAIQAAQDLERTLLDGTLADSFLWKDRVVTDGMGGLRRVQFEEAPDWWHRLEIVHDSKNDELRFIALTDRARAEESVVSGQLRLAEDLIRQTIADTRRDTKVAHALFEMLIPNRLKELAPNQLDLVLIVDEESGSYPWELLEDRWSTGGRPPAVAAGMLRQFKTAVFRERPTTIQEDNVYVVGDPLIIGATAELFPGLEGARRESQAVAGLLEKNGFNVTRQIQTDARSILAGLHDNGYRILHLAGHGVHELPLLSVTSASEARDEQQREAQSGSVLGMVIGDRIFLTPGDVEQMRTVPELVFINCCHLAKLTTETSAEHATPFHRLAANIAAQFIRMGVKAVVAAGWAVEDAAAETFATAFYTHLLAADKFGDAVRAARKETFERHSKSNTWGAYHCYGDPDFRLRPRTTAQKSASVRKYVSPVQVASDLENLAVSAQLGSDCASELKAIVRTLEKKHPVWLLRSEVAAPLKLLHTKMRKT